jgi:sarcosine oxidase, subunit alpha
VVKGPDAGRFLDMLYTNVMSTLPVGKCRYGLMCNEQGFLSDDGVVARLSEDSWLCHTTSGGADRIHAWMEDWLQCEWWDWQVFTANVTEQYGADRRRGPQGAQGAGKAGRHGRVARGAAVHGPGARAPWPGSGAGVPHLVLGRTQL